MEGNQAFYNPMVVQGDNEIWYTTSNNDVNNLSLKFYADSGMTDELTIQSNTYKDGIGKLVFDKPVVAIIDSFFSPHAGELIKVKSISLPKTIVVIGQKTFFDYDLSLLTIPEAVISIGDRAFDYLTCPIIMQSIIPPSATNNLFDVFKGLSPIYVPDNSVDAYKAATGWSAKADIIKPMSEYVE